MQNYFGQYPNVTPTMNNIGMGMQRTEMPVQNPQNMQNMQMQNFQNIFVQVANENVAKNYPVGYGNIVIFKDENEPKIYVKSMGFSQLESPIFESYRREENKPVSATANSDSNNLPYDELKAEITALKSEIEALKEKISTKRVKKEVSDNAE